jgi:hypothetical protein
LKIQIESTSISKQEGVLFVRERFIEENLGIIPLA